MRNTPSQAEFNYLWDLLLKQYPASTSYFNRVLAGIQSTQRVEEQNAIIKRTINSYISIIKLTKKLDNLWNFLLSE
ncbi:18445_t:CDS:2 [Dentiscutata erythropus]|uniref:18445_t:CDS:1 n=1 Tax=Dentiscutata erythropus TaxID=1348616 RepID=A0A9N8VRQ0_9GLOM|nr:18445_t:CDS:2 [Dentiscutata erythropus]